jgi:hypothetical protein
MTLHAVVAHQMLGNHPRALERRYHRKARGDEARRMHGGLRDPEHRRARDLTCRQQSRIAETGNYISIGIGILLDRVDQPHDAHRLVIMAFDRDGPGLRGDGRDLRAGARDGSRRGGDRLGH